MSEQHKGSASEQQQHFEDLRLGATMKSWVRIQAASFIALVLVVFFIHPHWRSPAGVALVVLVGLDMYCNVRLFQSTKALMSHRGEAVTPFIYATLLMSAMVWGLAVFTLFLKA